MDDSSLALPQFVEDISVHSRASVDWNSEDVYLHSIIPKTSGVFRAFLLGIRTSEPIDHDWFRARSSVVMVSLRVRLYRMR